jgi:CDP-diacylglycerol--glycerol-3-phosphate 3-phosphatidyltransferase
LVTNFGKVADPIADKLLTGTALIGLSVLGQLSWWVTWIILGREVAVTLLRFWVIRDGVIPASRGGKLKTAVQIVAIIGYLLPLSPAAFDVAQWIMALAVVLTLVTGIDYAVRAVNLHRRAVPAPEPARRRDWSVAMVSDTQPQQTSDAHRKSMKPTGKSTEWWRGCGRPTGGRAPNH